MLKQLFRIFWSAAISRYGGAFYSALLVLVLSEPVWADYHLPIVVSDPSFQSAHFSGSSNCGTCHNDLVDGEGTDVSIQRDWAASMMANSARDPYWRAKVASEISRNPGLKTIIGDTCSRCHMPVANVEVVQDGGAPELFGDGFLNPDNHYYSQAMDGVTCTVCHQIEDADLGALESFSGNFSIADLGASGSRRAFGQYTDPSVNPMLNSTGFRPVHGAHISMSAMCATCHNLKTPFVDADGNVASTTPESEFPEQMPYTEWENSAFSLPETGRSCQSCHMPETSEVAISNRPVSLAPRNQFARHTLVGANTTMLDILKDNRAKLGISATGFDASINRTRELLQSAAKISLVSSGIANGELTVVLKIQNLSGHKFPTSYPSRRAYIHFLAKDQAGNVVFESGKTNPDGSIVGNDADADLSTYEPHYQQITSEDQVQIYEPVIGNTDDEVTYTLLRSAKYLKDNRITPSGFDKNLVPDDVKVAGAASNDDDFNNGSDTITYRIPVNSGRGYSITVELNYQSLSYSHIQDLVSGAEDPEILLFKGMYENATLRYETVDTASRPTASRAAGILTWLPLLLLDD